MRGVAGISAALFCCCVDPAQSETTLSFLDKCYGAEFDVVQSGEKREGSVVGGSRDAEEPPIFRREVGGIYIEIPTPPIYEHNTFWPNLTVQLVETGRLSLGSEADLKRSGWFTCSGVDNGICRFECSNSYIEMYLPISSDGQQAVSKDLRLRVGRRASSSDYKAVCNHVIDRMVGPDVEVTEYVLAPLPSGVCKDLR